MAARQARRNVVLTDQAKDALGEFRRALSVRLDVDATYSAAILYAIGVAQATHDWLDATQGPVGLELQEAIDKRTEGRQP